MFFKINAILAVLFKNMYTLKFKSQLTFASFVAINHLNRNLRKQKFTSTSSKGHGLRFVVGEFLYILWFCCSLLVIVIIIASAKNTIVISSLLQFRIHVLLKSAVSIRVAYSQIRCIALRIFQTSKEFSFFLYCQSS